MRYWLIMPAAGSGRRFGAAVPKQYLELAGRKVIEHALAPFLADARCQQIVVALDPLDTQFRNLPLAADPRIRVVAGGAQRCDSVRNAVAAIAAADDDWVLVHDAARPCLGRADLDALLASLADDAVGGLLAAPQADTLKRADQSRRIADTPSRESLWRALTPQMFRLRPLREALLGAHLSEREPTDEAQAMEWAGHAARLVPGRPDNLKVTSPADLALAAAVLSQENGTMSFRVGSGFDVHAFGPGDGVMLGGVKVPWTHGVVAHSDGDVLLHALTDALLGAAGLGDIGQHFPDSDPRWRGAASSQFVAHALRLLAGDGWRVVNVDLTLLAEAPRVAAHRTAICQSVATALGVPLSCVNLKATTTEKLGFIGRSEGLAAQAVALVARG